MELNTGRPDPRAHTAHQLQHEADLTRVCEVGSDTADSVWDSVLTGTAHAVHTDVSGQGGWDLTPEEEEHLGDPGPPSKEGQVGPHEQGAHRDGVTEVQDRAARAGGRGQAKDRATGVARALWRLWEHLGPSPGDGRRGRGCHTCCAAGLLRCVSVSP